MGSGRFASGLGDLAGFGEWDEHSALAAPAFELHAVLDELGEQAAAQAAAVGGLVGVEVGSFEGSGLERAHRRMKMKLLFNFAGILRGGDRAVNGGRAPILGA